MLRARDRHRQLVIAVAVEAQRVRTRERVEHELTREAEEVERAGAILVEERARGEEVLAQRDLRFVVGAVRRIVVQRRRPLDRVAGRGVLVGVGPHLREPGPGGLVEVGGEPIGRLHDVRVGVVHRSGRVGHTRDDN